MGFFRASVEDAGSAARVCLLHKRAVALVLLSLDDLISRAARGHLLSVCWALFCLSVFWRSYHNSYTNSSNLFPQFTVDAVRWEVGGRGLRPGQLMALVTCVTWCSQFRWHTGSPISE